MHPIASKYVLSLATSVLLTASSSGIAQETLETKLQLEMAAMECPGAIVALQHASSDPEYHLLGVADPNTKEPMRIDAHMRAASVAKPFLGTAILLLADQGKLSVDDSIAKYVQTVPSGNEITLRQLANNTSGLFNTIENKDFQKLIVLEPQRSWTSKEILAFSFAKDSYNKPGELWRYSNTNAVLLGQVILQVTGMGYPEFILKNVSQPLGLESTDFIKGPTLPIPHPKGFRNGYENKWLGYGQTWYEVTDYSSEWAGAAGNLYSTARDLLKAAKPIATGQLLSEASRRELHQWVETNQEKTEYGFAIANYEGWIGHSGDVPGFSSFMGYSAEFDTSLVVLANLSNNKDGSSPANRLRDAALRHWKADRSQ